MVFVLRMHLLFYLFLLNKFWIGRTNFRKLRGSGVKIPRHSAQHRVDCGFYSSEPRGFI
jgi:hypothetical protein